MPYKNPEQRKEYQRIWMRKRRQDWLKKHGPCRVCASWEQLEVDHIDGATKLDHKVWSWARERRDAELAKCQVLCKKHHSEKSSAEIAGERNVTAKLTSKAVEEIRATVRDTKRLAKKFGVSERCIRQARAGEFWSRG